MKLFLQRNEDYNQYQKVESRKSKVESQKSKVNVKFQFLKSQILKERSDFKI